MTIIRLQDDLNYDFYFKKYWNSFVNSDTPKLHFDLDEFLEQMDNEDYLRLALNKMEYQNRLISCQYIKDDPLEHGFANFFLMHLPREHDLCCGSDYYFIYKNELETIEHPKKELFLPKRKTYKKIDIDPDSFDYLANFSIPITDKDYIYCLKCRTLLSKSDIFSKNKVVRID